MPEAFEWVGETTPELLPVAREAGPEGWAERDTALPRGDLGYHRLGFRRIGTACIVG